MYDKKGQVEFLIMKTIKKTTETLLQMKSGSPKQNAILLFEKLKSNDNSPKAWWKIL